MIKVCKVGKSCLKLLLFSNKGTMSLPARNMFELFHSLFSGNRAVSQNDRDDASITI